MGLLNRGFTVFLSLYESAMQHFKSVDIFCLLSRYSFYDGPPFATGLPHYGHILAGTIKVKKMAKVNYCLVIN